MEYKVKSINGKTEMLLKTGKDYVLNNDINPKYAQLVINKGKVEKSDRVGWDILVDNIYYFKVEKPTKKKKNEKTL